jgi:putative transcriptional regulator
MTGSRLSDVRACCTFSKSTMAGPTKYLQAQLLLDAGKLQGSFFHRTVVLVCQHDADGALGLVLNRASDNKVGEMLVADLPDILKDQRLFLGGPVQPSALSYLHTDTFVPQANVMPNLNLGHSLETLVDLGESYSTTQKVRLFAGYAGWSGGQLEDEMKRGAWLAHPASLDLVFHVQPENLWKIILEQKGWEYRLIADAPEDLSSN